LALKTIASNRLWVSGVAAVAVGVAFALFDPLSCRLFPRCLLHSWTGLYCPGCGTARALAQLAHGHWLAAIQLNPVTILGLPLLGALYVTGRLERTKPIWIWSFLAVMVVFGVLRNLPWPPFTWLAPQP
jgi:hypothetical protein